jgi:hypothetical protein
MTFLAPAAKRMPDLSQVPLGPGARAGRNVLDIERGDDLDVGLLFLARPASFQSLVALWGAGEHPKATPGAGCIGGNRHRFPRAS